MSLWTVFGCEMLPFRASPEPTLLSTAFTRAGRARPEVDAPCANGERMKNEAVIDGITVGGQPTAAESASGRFATVINLREADEPGNDTGSLLAGTDVAYAHVPWTIDTVTNADIAHVRAAVDAASGPVLIHCMGATRAAVAASLVSAENDGSGAAGALSKLAGAGFAIEGTPYAEFVRTYFVSSQPKPARNG